MAFYEEHPGLRVSDWLRDFMGFMRCNAVHHGFAFIPGPTSLNHVAFEMRDLDEMMRGVSRLVRANVVLGWGPGRHTAGNNAFSYFVAPSGNVLEYIAEVQRIDEASWRPTVYPPSPEGRGSVGDRITARRRTADARRAGAGPGNLDAAARLAACRTDAAG